MTEPEVICVRRALESICLDCGESTSQLVIKPYLNHGQFIGNFTKFFRLAPIVEQVVYNGVFLKA